MDERFLYDFRTGCGNSTKFARIFDMGFMPEKRTEILLLVRPKLQIYLGLDLLIP